MLNLTLHASSYVFQFAPVSSATFTDAGTGLLCNGDPSVAASSATATSALGRPHLEAAPAGEHLHGAAVGSTLAPRGSQLLARTPEGAAATR